MIHPTEEYVPTDEPITQQPIVRLKDNLLSPTAHHKQRLGSAGRMAKPQANWGIAESLQGITHLFIKQTVISAEFFVNALNKYEILNSSGERVFLAAETTDFLTRFCYGGFQPFKLSVYNSKPTHSVGPRKEKSKSFLEVLKLNGSPGICTSVGHVNVTDGIKPLGSVQQLEKFGSPLYSVRTVMGDEILQVRGPDIGRCCFGLKPLISSLEFEIIDPKDETMVGRILKQWGGFAREIFTKADIWGIKFPPNMETSTKALLLATVFLIDFQYFER